jgi:hypothetical protein
MLPPFRESLLSEAISRGLIDQCLAETRFSSDPRAALFPKRRLWIRCPSRPACRNPIERSAELTAQLDRFSGLDKTGRMMPLDSFLEISSLPVLSNSMRLGPVAQVNFLKN